MGRPTFARTTLASYPPATWGDWLNCYNEPCMTKEESVQERSGAVTLRGNKMTLVGPELKLGQKAPDFDAVTDSLQPVNLEKTGHGVRIFSVIPSLDTPVCDAQTKRFNEELANLPDVDVFT